MKTFNQLLAISGASMAASLGTLGIGEYQDHAWRQDRQECYAELGAKSELCDYDPEIQKNTQEMYELLAFGLGAISITVGLKAYSENQDQIKRDRDYRRAEGFK